MPLDLSNDEMLISDENGKDHLMKILFTYENEERHKSYVFLYEKDKENDVLAFAYNEQSHELEEILDEDEYKEVEEVFNAYMEDPKIQEVKEEK